MAKFDTLLKTAIREHWPKKPAKLWSASITGAAWLRGQPPDGKATGPRFMTVGMSDYKTHPDALYVCLSAGDRPFADCVAIEATGSAQNFQDKRSRYGPTSASRLLHCPLKWLLGKAGAQKRWQAVAGLAAAPADDLVLPVRLLRSLYFLKDDLYDEWTETGVPEPHEFVARYSSVKSIYAKQMRTFLERMTLRNHFYIAP
ncbi:MAG: hypothetical protein ACLP1X_23795 [Polyangiaceae bacterium]